MPKSLQILLLLINFRLSWALFFELGGSWHFFSKNQPNISGNAQVPGDIYADLFANGFIELWADPLFGRGDDFYRWVPRHRWVYEKTFQPPEGMHKANFVLLQLAGIDSPAAVVLNNRTIVAQMDNQFVAKSVDIWADILPRQNVLQIEFESPVEEANFRAEKYKVFQGHKLPPECTPPVYNGECHVQFVRKMQASFGWDWGPSFPTVGIWRPVQLEYFDRLSIQSFSPMVSFEKDNFVISARLTLICAIVRRPIRVKLRLLELGMDKEFVPKTKKCPNWKLDGLKMKVPAKLVQLWHPIGYGTQPMYTLEVKIMENDFELAFARKRIAFRTVRLNQSLVNASDPAQGRLFQFELNGVPIFLKGTNWVPISLFPARDHSERRKFSLQSAVKANSNVLRVWGGGFYEMDEFYEQADEIDFMFACSLYPTDSNFLQSVEAEIEEQVLRLRHHPSVLCWATNNENELAVRSQWYPSWDYPEEAQARDYVRLYKTHIQTVAMALDPTRPVLLSSPSNGVETEREGGVSRNPADPAFGDVHFYTESVNLWKAYNYPVPRCASEFGVQSMPLRGTMARWLDPSDWTYRSATLVKRQHHPGGVLNLPLLVFQHFNIPLMNSSSTTAFTSLHDIISAVSHPAFMDQFAFLSQIHQAVALQTQIEHYRRFRSHLNTAGLGRTMCAMYWQLNDVWAAPTWSTLDFDLRWKIGHHFVRRSFAPLILSMFLDLNGRFRLWAVSDLLAPIQNANVRLSLFCFRSGLSPIFTGEVSVSKILPLSSQEISLPNWPSFASATDFSYDEGIYLLIADLIGPNGDLLSPRAVLYPDRLSRAGLYGNATVSGFRDGPNGTYSVDITADDVLPLLWLDLSDAFKKANPEVLFFFEENAFPATSPRHSVTLRLATNPKRVQICKDDVILIVL